EVGGSTLLTGGADLPVCPPCKADRKVCPTSSGAPLLRGSVEKDTVSEFHTAFHLIQHADLIADVQVAQVLHGHTSLDLAARRHHEEMLGSLRLQEKLISREVHIPNHPAQHRDGPQAGPLRRKGRGGEEWLHSNQRNGQ